MTTVAYVLWFDSAMTDHSTVSMEDAATICENETAGILLREDVKSITLALDHNLSFNSVRSTICIPKVNVTRIERWNVPCLSKSRKKP